MVCNEKNPSFYDIKELKEYCKEKYNIEVPDELKDGVNIINNGFAIFVFNPIEVYDLKRLGIEKLEDGEILKINNWDCLFYGDKIYRIVKYGSRIKSSFRELKFSKEEDRRRIRINGERYTYRKIEKMLNKIKEE